MKTIKAELSTQSLNNLLQKINGLKDNLNKASKECLLELADYTRAEIENNLSLTEYKDGNEDAQTFIEEKEDKIIVGMKGTQVLYDEFGTGTEGANSPHPMKSNFGLNKYNSGKTIRPNKKANSGATENGVPLNGLYWTYKDKSGNKVYTQGIPAGKQVFNASLSLKSKKKQVVKKKVSDALSKL